MSFVEVLVETFVLELLLLGKLCLCGELVCHFFFFGLSAVSFALHFVAKLLALLKFVVQALNVPLPLTLKVCVVALKGVHFAAETRLVLLVKDRSLLVICS